MRLLYIGNWALQDGLTQATVLPNLKLLLQNKDLERLVFVTIERNGIVPPTPHYLNDERIIYAPLIGNGFPIKLVNQFFDLIAFQKKVGKLLDIHKVDKVIARGSPAGGLIYKVCLERGIPFFVESFEPHASYMLESGVWKKWDPRYLVQHRWEESVKETAAGIMPVAQHHKNVLIEEGVPASKIAVCPCTVDLEKFRIEEEKRVRIRRAFNIPEEALVGVYVGKFGGYYFNEEAFLLYKKLMAVQDFWVIIVSPDNPDEIYAKATAHQVPLEKIKVASAKHDEVSGYLSAADFAFATIKPSPSKRFLSLIKIGEYWACGLPVIITENIGDDSEFIREEKIGIVLKDNWAEQGSAYFSDIMHTLRSTQDKTRIRSIAEKRRSIRNTMEAYSYFQLV